MNKNTVIGLLLIGAVLFGFSWYNSKQVAATQEAATSTATPLSSATPLPNNNQGGDTFSTVSTPEVEGIEVPEEFPVLENDLIKVTFGTKGGRVASVELKEYKTYNGDPLMLFEAEMVTGVNGGQRAGSRFDLLFYTPERFHTGERIFTPRIVSDDQLAMRLAVDSASYLEYLYTLRPDEYRVDMRIDLSGLKGRIDPQQPDVILDWSIVSPQQEKGFDNENTYTTVAYRFPGESAVEELGFSTENKSERIGTKVNWVGFKQQFFSSILVGPSDAQNANWNNFSGAEMGYQTYAPTARNIKEFWARVGLPYDHAGVDGYELGFYFGPNKYSLLKQYSDLEFQRLVPLGWGIFGWVNRWIIIPIFDFLTSRIGGMGLAILLLTLIVKLLIFPLTYKSYLSTAKMRLLKPDIDKINEKYPKKEDALKKQQAVMGLYKSAGVSPLGGCLPMLIQMPILIALFRFFPASIELRGRAFLWADDLSAYDSVLDLGFSIPFYGDHISLFTLLMAVSLFITSKINYAQQAASSTQQMPGMKFMMLYLMPAMLLLWFNNYAAGLTYYYFLSNVITLGQTMAFRYGVDEEKLHAKMKENAKKPVKKSKFQQRLEEMQRQQQNMKKGR